MGQIVELAPSPWNIYQQEYLLIHLLNLIIQLHLEIEPLVSGKDKVFIIFILIQVLGEWRLMGYLLELGLLKQIAQKLGIFLFWIPKIPKQEDEFVQRTKKIAKINIGVPYYYFTISHLSFVNLGITGTVNTYSQVDDNQMLDGQWNQIYNRYNRTAKDRGLVFYGVFVRSITNLANKKMILMPLQYYFCIFLLDHQHLNYQTNITSSMDKYLMLDQYIGNGGLIEIRDDLKKFAGKKTDFPKLQPVRQLYLKNKKIR